MSPKMRKVISISLLRAEIALCIVLSAITMTKSQFRNDQDQEYYRYNRDQPYPGYTTPQSIRSRYNSGDTYYGTDRRYDTRFDDPSQVRGFDNRYQEQSFRYGEDNQGRYGSNRYDARGRERPGFDGRPYDSRNANGKLGVLDHWRPDLQGQQRPSETPGINLPLADLFVTTDSGKVQGFYVYLYDKPGVRPADRPVQKPIHQQRHIMNISTFLGIPYARPPIEEGRFKPPRYVQHWFSTWQALDFRPACPQNLKYIGSSNGIRSGINEDCLYLNIFTPSISIGVSDQYPVMFYIHGGDLEHGASNQFPGHMLAGWGEVVVVTFNYRLGALGFLSTGDENSPGNYGLMDMAMALEWVYRNIRFFNGDPQKITVFGPGAGGAMAGILAVLPKTKDWVHQVLAESGSPLADWAALDDVYRVQNTSRVYGLEVGCTVESSYKLLQCLNRRSYEELASAPIKPDIGTFAWGPTVDSKFRVPGDDWYEEWKEADWHILPELPLKLYEKNHHHYDLRYLTGVNRNEAANMVFEDNRLIRDRYEVTEDFFNERVKEYVKHYNYSLNPQGAYDAIKWMYTYGPDPHNTTHIREQYVDMLSDALYKSSVDQMVKVLVNSTGKKSVPTYYYLLNTTVDALKLDYWREVPNNIEYYFVFGGPFMDPEFFPESIRVARNLWSEGDRNISEFMMKTFVNFAKWGNPTQTQVQILKVNWEPVLEGNLKYLSINTTFNTSMHYNYRQTYNTFWTTYIPQVVREWVPTVPPPINPWIEMTEPIVAAFYGAAAVAVFLLVILFVCCGLWKSAKRQRNKALTDLVYFKRDTEALRFGGRIDGDGDDDDDDDDDGDDLREYLAKLAHPPPSRSVTPSTNVQRNKALDDLQYYSTENLTPQQESEDYKVREYLNKLANNNHDETPSRSVTPYTVASTDPIIQTDHNNAKSRNPYQQDYYKDTKTAKSVDQLEQPYRPGYQNMMPSSRSAGNIIENYHTSYHNPGAELNGHYQPQQQRSITPTSTIHSEPNGRPTTQYMMTQQVTKPPEREVRTAPQPAARVSRSVATITSTSGMLNTDL